VKTVLSVASECAPLIKTGGLADVVGALPAAMAPEGWRLLTLVPGYPAVMDKLKNPRRVRRERYCFSAPGNVLYDEVDGLEVLVLEAPHLYERTGSIYLGPDGQDWPDNPERFAALSWVAARLATMGFDKEEIQVLHAHDWQGALAPLYLQEMGGDEGVGTLLTVHNIAFHGWAPPSRLRALRLPRSLYTHELLEYHGRVNALKAGLLSADKISTVSPTYARELLTPEFGMGLDGVLRTREADLVGILNGIDEAGWNPAKDPAITPFSAPSGKAANKKALLEEFGLDAGDGPVFVVVSRLTGQKGLDLLLDCLHVLQERDARLILLGSGEGWLEDAWQAAAADMPEVSVKIGYDEALSHRIIAGGDMILVPSRFEPCGLTQLYGLRYGTVPIVARTGGLADTVIHANDAARSAGVATGFQFAPVTSDTLRYALNSACDLYSDQNSFTQVQENAMAQPVGWEISAPRYAALYDSLRNDD